MIKYEAPRRKSVGEQAMDMAVYLLTVGAIYLVLYWTFMAVTAPFRLLFWSDGQRLEAKIKRAKEKIARREALREKRAADENDPMNQYLLRYKLYSDEYVGDPDNEKYRQWFEGLKNGDVLDTRLTWAPEVYGETKAGRVVSGKFLDYFARQVELHSAKSIGVRVAFMRTVRDLYPEFTPRFSVLAGEIEDMRERAESGQLYLELVAELEKKGVPVELASELVGLNLGPEKLCEAIVMIKKGLGRGYSQEFCLFCVSKNIDLDDPFVKAYGGAFDKALINLQDETIVLALIKQEVTPVEIGALVDAAKEVTEDGDERREIISQKYRELMKDKCVEEISYGR